MVDGLPPQGIYVLAGTNGAGKSSVIGRALDAEDIVWVNPDLITRELMDAEGLTLDDANAAAWQEMVERLQRAIENNEFFAFETTLGGRTITAALEDGAIFGVEVRILYVALRSADMHVERVRARVEDGGHDVPEERIRARYDAGRLHLIQLLPFINELWLFDNSDEADVRGGEEPQPKLILHVREQRIEELCPLGEIPLWARPIVMSAIDIQPFES